MPGYRQWTNGDNLTPADLDSYLMGQTLMRFANQASRDAAITSPVDGMVCYQTDTGFQYQYSQSSGAWVPIVQYIKKTANESVTSSVTMQDDDHFQVTLVPGIYEVRVRLHVTGATGGDIQIIWAFSGSLNTFNRTCMGMTPSGTDTTNTSIRISAHNYNTAVAYGTEASSGGIFEDHLINVGTTGLLKMQWAQNTSSTTATVVSAASRMIISKVA